MSSWLSINKSNHSDFNNSSSNNNNNNNNSNDSNNSQNSNNNSNNSKNKEEINYSNYEYNLLKEYEENIQNLSIIISSFTSFQLKTFLIHSSNSSLSSNSSNSSLNILNNKEFELKENWMKIKENFENIILKLNNLINKKYKIKLKYLCLKNLSFMKEKEENYLDALQDALNAIHESMNENNEENYNNNSNINNNNNNIDLVLLIRTAYLSIQSKQLWLCRELLYSGHLSKALKPVLWDLHKKYSEAILNETPTNFLESKTFVKSPIKLEIQIPNSSFTSNLRLLSIQEYLKIFSCLKISQIKEYIENRSLNIQFIYQQPFNNSTNLDINLSSKSFSTIFPIENNQHEDLDSPMIRTIDDTPITLTGESIDSNEQKIKNKNELKRKSNRQRTKKYESDYHFHSNSSSSTNKTTEGMQDSTLDFLLNRLENFYQVNIFIFINF